jgi:tetratricopeptide (TPR) repeat protein
MRLNIAKCCMSLRDYDHALEAYLRVLELEKLKKTGADEDLLYDVNANLGLIYHKRKEYDRARGILEDLRRQYPDRLPARTTLATVYKKMRLYDRAIPEFLFVIAQEPRNIVALNNLANIYRDTGQTEPARRYYEKCLALDPNNPVVLKNMQRLDGRLPAATDE